MPCSHAAPNADLEKIPAGEAEQIEETTELMGALVDRRYTGKPRFLRGVHAKDHGCVEATFTVSDTLAPEHRVGLFATPGASFRAAIRFSNAAPLVTDDAPHEPGPPAGALVRTQGSRGMAIKVYDVPGDRLVREDGERTQDFLMINQPVFAFANVEDYLALNRIIRDDDNAAPLFFTRPNQSPDAQKRTATSRGIIARIKGFLPPAFQAPPLSPLDNIYFSAAPFSLGEGRAMKFACNPINPMTGDLGDAVNDPDYLRSAMRKRIAEAEGKTICFDFQIQVRDAASLAGRIDTDIEDACTEWKEPFVTVARIEIPPQDISSPERQELCERLFYTPWHGLVEHRPLGGINRLRLKVYDVSAERRGCPVAAAGMSAAAVPATEPPGRASSGRRGRLRRPARAAPRGSSDTRPARPAPRR
jgi:hypothetical protein